MLDKLKLTELVGSFTRKLRQPHDDLRPFCTTKSVEVIVTDKDGNVKHRSVTTKNLRVNGGADFWNAQLFATTPAAGSQANYIALTTDTAPPAAGDTTLTAEETTNGLARAQGTVTHTAAASSTLISKTFTYSGSTSKTIAKVGLFNQLALGGTLVLETLLASTATVNTNGDQITINWTVQF